MFTPEKYVRITGSKVTRQITALWAWSPRKLLENYASSKTLS